MGFCGEGVGGIENGHHNLAVGAGNAGHADGQVGGIGWQGGGKKYGEYQAWTCWAPV
jgi:hypothetical protein